MKIFLASFILFMLSIACMALGAWKTNGRAKRGCGISPCSKSICSGGEQCGSPGKPETDDEYFAQG